MLIIYVIVMQFAFSSHFNKTPERVYVIRTKQNLEICDTSLCFDFSYTFVCELKVSGHEQRSYVWKHYKCFWQLFYTSHLTTSWEGTFVMLNVFLVRGTFRQYHTYLLPDWNLTKRCISLLPRLIKIWKLICSPITTQINCI